MHAAPPVQVALADGRHERLVAALIWLVAAGSLGTWLCLRTGIDAAPIMAMAGVVSVAGLFGWLAWRLGNPMRGTLMWDGQAWACAPVGQLSPQPVGPVSTSLDLGFWILLRAASGRWCSVYRRDAGANWHGLRVALRASAGAANGPRSQP